MAGNKRFGSLPILGVLYKFGWRSKDMPADAKDDFGETFPDEQRIAVNVEKHKSESGVEQTMLHELIHATLYVSGHSEQLDSKQEEAIVRALENGLYPAIVRLVKMGYFRGAA